MGYRLILRIMTGVVVFWLLLNVLVLRETNYPVLKPVLGYIFILIIVVLFVLLYLNRYRPE